VNGYYSDVIVHKDQRKRVEGFMDLRGTTWAYPSEKSISGNLLVLGHLKALGESSSFFGNFLVSGNHRNSISLVWKKKAEAAAVDSNALAYFLDLHPEAKHDIQVIESLGPLSPYPIVVSKLMPDETKKAITSALLKMHEDLDFGPKLKVFHINKFLPHPIRVYEKEITLRKVGAGGKIGMTYY